MVSDLSLFCFMYLLLLFVFDGDGGDDGVMLLAFMQRSLCDDDGWNG